MWPSRTTSLRKIVHLWYCCFPKYAAVITRCR